MFCLFSVFLFCLLSSFTLVSWDAMGIMGSRFKVVFIAVSFVGCNFHYFWTLVGIIFWNSRSSLDSAFGNTKFVVSISRVLFTLMRQKLIIVLSCWTIIGVCGMHIAHQHPIKLFFLGETSSIFLEFYCCSRQLWHRFLVLSSLIGDLLYFLD